MTGTLNVLLEQVTVIALGPAAAKIPLLLRVR
jgi:hypothetical protein